MLLPLKKKKAPTTDEENSLCIESSSKYGAIPAASAHSSDESSHSDPEEGEGGSSSHSSIKKRKKRRMEQRHCCKKSRPKISSRLSSMLHHGSKKRHSSDSEDDLRATNLVLPALDPNAKEVKESIQCNSSLDQLLMRQQQINLSTVRANYRVERRKARLVCLALSYWDLGSFAIRFFISKHPISVLFSFRCLIELFTTIPFMISIYIPHGRYLYVPYFIRSWVLLLRIKSVMKIKINLQLTDKPVDPLRTKLIILTSTLIVLLFTGTCAFQYSEVTFGTSNYTILESLYVVMVTLSTVGYGDITPNTQASRIVMMLLIVIALSVLPGLVTDVSDTLRKRKEGEGHVSRGSTSPFILIVGSFTPDQVVEILDGFLNTENTEYHLSVVFLDINRPTEQLKVMERNSIWGHRVQFLHGSVLDEKTLLRVEARYAEAIFTISDQNASEPSKEDERNTVRLWSLYCHTVSHNVPIFTYNLSPSTAIYQKVAKEIICVREFKQYLLAMNCRCRGASTLLTNLLHQRQPINQYDEGWQAQFDDGSCNEIYTGKAPHCIEDLTFGQAALFLFEEAQVILFAIKTFMEERNDYEILLNPSNSYKIKKTDECVYIAEGPREIQDIRNLPKPSPTQFNTASDFVQPGNNKSTQNYQHITESSTKASESTPLQQSTHNLLAATFNRQPSSTSTSTSRSYTSQKSTSNVSLNQTFGVSKLPSKRHALLTGSRALIKRIGKSSAPEKIEDDTSLPLCYLLDEPVQLDDVTIQDTDGMSNHVLVCLHREVINMFKFIYNLRSPNIKADQLQDIVLLCSKKPSQKIFELINTFPKVYFMEGNCRHPDDLLRAGAKRAKQIVVMSEKECLDQYERNSDSPAVMASHILDLLLQERPTDAYTIVNLIEKSNIKFMHLLQGKDVAEEIDVFYTPAYAAGDVVADSLISNVLLSQTYYKPDIVSIIKTLCGMPGPLYDGSAAYLLSTTPEITSASAAARLAPHLTSIRLPIEFVGRNYSVLFKTLLIQYEVLAIGLYRAPDDELGNELPFVYANPVPSLILKDSDMIYVFSPPGWVL
ncbi:hypothetical protein FB192DRAFT_1447653 [Mucor lusitanicus]|uniref:Calcium-activated potassium channel BK alpha subunit domain-containing protein n=2 Tax=Mucor circinelloides f. lusitanicus TaxID=29924 RepID=A0A168HY25_MUCCL|nr:hypothetical protein FB192DRAFT_1447653 [Mucor lusitanicus]OAC99324.1 hypothetical protein MUCCIDRAFT_114509 [Mucor lusitanicus CBS 277.49]